MTTRPGVLVRLADLGHRRRGRTVLAWIAALAAVLALSTTPTPRIMTPSR